MNKDYLKKKIELDMSHVRLGFLNEYSMMTIFGNIHSHFLATGVKNNPAEITDNEGRILYPAYFMTHLKVPPEFALSSFSLWDTIQIGVKVRKFGNTILESDYFSRPTSESVSLGITMKANSLFILDPSIFRTREKQVSGPKPGMTCDMEKMPEPPGSIKESSSIRLNGLGGIGDDAYEADPYLYKLELERDTDPSHPLLFAKFSTLMNLSEANFLKQYTNGKISEDLLQAVSLLERKTFYYGNAFAGSILTIHTKGVVKVCSKSLWMENPRLNYMYSLDLQSEIYNQGELLAISHAKKVIVHEIRHQALIQDTKRLIQ